VGVAASKVTENINATIARGGAVAGTVTDAATGKPIILATAAVVGAPPQICKNPAATNCSVNGLSGEEGEYRTLVIAPGEHTLEFSASGYATKSVAATVTATHTTTLNVALEPATSGGGGTGGSGSGGGTGGSSGGGGTGGSSTGGGGSGGGGGVASTAGAPGVPAQTVTVGASGGGTITVDCNAAGPCTGTLTVSVSVQGATAVGAHASKRRRIVIGSASFTSVPAGKPSKVSFRLNATGRRLLKRAHGKLKVTAAIAYAAAGKKVTTKRVVLVRRSGKH
jgi:hypothetical protein